MRNYIRESKERLIKMLDEAGFIDLVYVDVAEIALEYMRKNYFSDHAAYRAIATKLSLADFDFYIGNFSAIFVDGSFFLKARLVFHILDDYQETRFADEMCYLYSPFFDFVVSLVDGKWLLLYEDKVVCCGDDIFQGYKDVFCFLSVLDVFVVDFGEDWLQGGMYSFDEVGASCDCKIRELYLPFLDSEYDVHMMGVIWHLYKGGVFWREYHAWVDGSDVEFEELNNVPVFRDYPNMFKSCF